MSPPRIRRSCDYRAVRGLRGPLDAGDDATSVLPRNTRCPPAPGEEQWSTF